MLWIVQSQRMLWSGLVGKKPRLDTWLKICSTGQHLNVFINMAFYSADMEKGDVFAKWTAYQPRKMMGALPAAEVLTDITCKTSHGWKEFGFRQARSTYHWVCHWADPSIQESRVLACCVHWQGMEKGPLNNYHGPFVISLETTIVRRGIPCIADCCLCNPPTLLEFWQKAGGAPGAPPPSSCTMCEGLSCSPSAPVVEVDANILTWNNQSNIVHLQANLSEKPKISWLDLLFQGSNSGEPFFTMKA